MDGDFNALTLIDHLEQSADVIRLLVQSVLPEQEAWRPTADAWSVLEVIGHLLDEEREDFRVRLGLLLEDPDAEWPPIDPQGWVKERSYATRDLWETLESFLEERFQSLIWLRELPPPEWSRKKTHPVAGSLAAGDMLAAWAAHDLLHIRQLTRLHLQYVKRIAAPYATEYAGAW
ncbi:DinB family protein [Candidatus Bipolaricaulota bacterium]|nr:DinB family protein [Candidatus Bipolaricaulota bacterium]